MDWWEYLYPDNPLSARVVAALTYGFYVWLILVLAKVGHLAYQRWQMSRLRSVTPLRDELARRARGRRGADEDEGRERPDDDSQVKEVFDDFCRQTGAQAWSVVAGHVRSIFGAGWKGSQLQVDSLSPHTSNRLFRFNGVLRSMLSLFIIGGLLGTLFGLAASLAQLSPLMSETAQQQQQLNGLVGQGLRHLLRELKGAFAPSIFGVIYTIAGVLIFALYSYFCRYVRDTLDGLTQDVWLADLYPSPFQQQLMSLVQTEELIQKNREHVELVAEVASNIRPDMVRLQQNIGDANITLESLTDTSTRISDFAERFREGVARLEPFQDDLRALYSQMQSDSRVFQQSVRASVQQSASFQQQAGEMLTRQGEKIEDLLKALDSYETAYVKARREIDAKLVEVLNQAKDAYRQLGARNEEIDRAIRESLADPLRKDLADKLGEVHETLGGKLGDVHTTLGAKLTDVVNMFGRLYPAINDSAERVRIIADTIDRKSVELTGKLRQEYRAQVSANKGQLESLAALTQKLGELLTEFAEAGKAQNESAGALKDATAALGRRLDTLAAKLDSAAAQKSRPDGEADFGRIERLANGHTAAIIKELRALGSAFAGAADGYSTVRGGPGPRVQGQGRHQQTPEPARHPAETAAVRPPEHEPAVEDRPERAAVRPEPEGAQTEEPRGAADTPSEERLAGVSDEAPSEDPGFVKDAAGEAGDETARPGGEHSAGIRIIRNYEEEGRRGSRVRRMFGSVAGAVRRAFWRGE